MRLSKIKLAGFKSFVDATEVLLPTNLTGVVGPNGCGKSNIIDAVRWVMGETSAKMLRGTAMTDVIFSGSASRKPVGMATVELIFDNSDGQIQGEYGRYNEISVKRQVNREAQSNYFLNGSKCRKKDIVDLFLGTGLGPRSYSIIEQGMISNIVESKPEELRGYIEEAAGVSKYRERRRETERRISRTRENLERLDDLRTEVGKHIQHLQRQAKNAEKYTALKKQSKQIKADILTLRWHQWQHQAQTGQQQIQQLETAYEKARSGQTDSEKNITLQRDAFQKSSDKNHQLQEQLYQINGHIGKIEQAISHAQNLSEKNKQDLSATELDLKRQQQQLGDDSQGLAAEQKVITAEQPRLDTLQAQLESAREMAEEYEAQRNQWRNRWDELQQNSAKKQQNAEVEKTKISALESGLMRQVERLNNQQDPTQHHEADQWQQQLEQLRADSQSQQQKLDKLNKQLAAVKDDQQANDQRINHLRNELDELRQQQHQLSGERGSLKALQQAAQSHDNNDLKQWLKEHHNINQQRLATLIKVESGWENAVETVLSQRLQALVSGSDDLTSVLQDWQFGPITAINDQQGQFKVIPGRLAEHVTGPDVVLAWLNSVHTAEDIQQAQTMRTHLAADESVVTAAGDWLGRHWMSVNRGSTQENFLLRQKQLAELEQAIENLKAHLENSEKVLTESQQQRQKLNQQREQIQLDVNMAHRKLSETESQLKHKQQLIEREQQQNQQQTLQRDALKQQIKEDQTALAQAQKQLQTAIESMKSLQQDRSDLQEQQQDIDTEYQQAKAQFSEISETFYQSKLRLSAAENKMSALQQSVSRGQQAMAQLQQRKDDLLSQLNQHANPVADQQKDLDKLIQQRIKTEQLRQQQTQEVETLQAQLVVLEQNRASHQQKIEQARTALEQAKLNSQSHQLKADAFAEQLADLGFTPQQVMAEDDLVDVNVVSLVDQKETQMEQLHRNIVRLEPVNLAAIEEYEEESKRKNYLDEQNEDLRQALDTLEQAIARIDKDTRTLFKETFEAVNSHIKKLFPRLFGGGHAYLELTGQDLLTTGVAIMARPPGKRVSSIQLLSGGEKALTAVSLVFAIFNLNPAPFCLLDEVDAPLDDANVSRFSAMVKEMSEKVQFLFVTHNKMTMEIANQLMGVTMREAGVSRLVSVDLAAATELVDD